jgi:hypothetical protein
MLSRAFRRLPSAQLLHEREAEGGPIWWDGSDPEEDPPDEVERSRSYHVFFVSPEGEPFRFETEAEGIVEPEFMTEEFEEAGWGEDPPVSRIHGSGRTGWVVAVSLLAPFAVIELGDVSTFEDGNTTEAEIESYAETEDGERINQEEHFRKFAGAQAYEILLKLRAKIGAILEKCGITVLPAEEWRKPVPWLRGGEETLVGIEGRPVRVLDAFFYFLIGEAWTHVIEGLKRPSLLKLLLRSAHRLFQYLEPKRTNLSSARPASMGAVAV